MLNPASVISGAINRISELSFWGHIGLDILEEAKVHGHKFIEQSYRSEIEQQLDEDDDDGFRL